MAALGAGAIASTVAVAPVAAQDYTNGAISGTVTDASGGTVAGATVTLTSVERGFTRTSTSSSNGNFRFTGLPAGDYDVVVSAPGSEEYRAEAVPVLPSQTVTLNATLPASGGDVIVVTGVAAVNDFQGQTTGLNIDLEETVKTIPISRDLTSVVLLAPGTQQGDSAFGNLASVSGTSVAENAYYLNGLNITNFDNYLGSARVPFEFYQTVETKTGGFPAEFGRAIGGIINATSKSGTNEYSGAVHLNWEPNWLQSPGEDIRDQNGVTTLRRYDESDSYSAIVELGGPIITDRLFAYGLVELREVDNLTINPRGNSARRQVQDDPFWAVKIDAYPIDSQHFEFTIFDTSRTTDITDYEFDIESGTLGGQFAQSAANFGGVNFVGKYTGSFTDWLSVSAAYGKNRDRFDNVLIGAGSDVAYVVNSNSDVPSVNGVPFGGFYTDQRTASITSPYETEREFYRADVDLYFSLFGTHHVRAGFDVENLTLARTTVRTGSEFLANNSFISDAAVNANAGNAGIAILIQEGNQVELNYFNSGGVFDQTNRAFYIQDEWLLTDRLTLNLGLRRDDFKSYAADGSVFANLKENYAPRVGFNYELFDDRSGQIYGYFGQYFLPIASNTAFRQVGSEFFFRERFELAGFEANGLPILGDQITDRADFQRTCPFGLTPQSSGQNCAVTGDGSVPTAANILAEEAKPTRESEYILGYKHDFGAFNVGLSYIRRETDRVLEDVSVDGAVLQYCADNGIANCEDEFTGFHQYVFLNPGNEATFLAFASDTPGLNGETLTFTADELGYPEATRTYDAVQLTFERPWDGSWLFGGSYTWSESKGNSEGFVQSDFGQDDAGATQDFDVPEFTDFAYGYLPNHRRHRLKLRAAKALGEHIVVGTNTSLLSPRKLSCFGYHPTAAIGNLYGAASHYCGLEPAPRGEGLETDWRLDVNLSGRYNIELASGNVITFRADVFNLFNSQAITQRNEIGDSDITGSTGTETDSFLDDFPTSVSANPNYGFATGYQTARSVRLGIDITF